jgi:oligosaccharide reducing-end xylanase
VIWHVKNTAPYTTFLSPDGSGSQETNPAPDGEEYFITALFFADKRWASSANGIFNYQAEANNLLDVIKNKPENQTRYPIINIAEKQVTFITVKNVAQFTDPSYHLPSFYEYWAAFGGHDSDFWHDAAAVSRNFFENAAHPTTGLFSDYASFQGVPQTTTFNSRSAISAYDSYRVIMNMAMDYTWVSKSDALKNLVDRQLAFFHSKRVNNQYNGIYQMDGTLPSSSGDIYTSAGRVAMNATGALVYDSTTAPAYVKNFVQDLWSMQTPSGLYRYYDGMLYMMAMLQVSGEYKIYK